MVTEIKAASADGKISEAEKRRIKDAAVSNVKSYLGAKAIRVLAEVLGRRETRSTAESSTWS